MYRYIRLKYPFFNGLNRAEIRVKHFDASTQQILPHDTAIADPNRCGPLNCGLTAAGGRGDKAFDENVFRHLRHLHYWLAHALVRTFSPFLLSDKQTHRPAGQRFMYV